ncbi:MAG: bifunctional precorrin-2 dehydrogenase/sirohydrochlorin ferrochelatase, partial [Oscillospiraceae bacterium]|nr:bifunctional precorrin-2 dehydrogenase/sirohydrochlorin ferrochelatase [Oscillospiraceae bacterium]
MAYFPLSIDLSGKTVFLVGSGKQIQEKWEKLQPFSPNMICLRELSETDFCKNPVLVIAGDMEYSDAERISRLCMERNIPVNVVDIPQLCTFFFPSLIVRGDLTVSVSTGGKSPAGAAYLRRQIEDTIPNRTEEILCWLGEHRSALRKAGILKDAVALAFENNRPLS